jgi:hypothetical protein
MRSGLRFALFLVVSLALAAQSARVRAALDFDAIPRPPLPADPLELVTSAAQPAEDAQQRIAALGLLNQARDLSNVRAQPYDLKTSVSASGGLPSDGTWTLEDTARGRGYRWTAEGPNYFAVNLYPNGVENGLYETRPGGTMPLRLLQARAAIFFVYPRVGPRASVRTATGFLNGAEQHCVLLSIGAGARTFTGARNWEESEYCMDGRNGLLSVYSPVPGLYVHYDYSSSIRFHNKYIPTGFTITQAGQTVVDARTIGVTDPPASTDAVFQPVPQAALGVGRSMNPAVNLPMVMPAPGQPFPPPTTNATMQVVTLHGNVTPDGGLGEVEILASSDASLNQAVLEHAKMMKQVRAQVQPGATAPSSELILTFELVTPAQ